METAWRFLRKLKIELLYDLACLLMQGMQVRSLGQEDPPEKGSWQPTPVFSPVKSHGQRSLVGYILWGHKELDMIERMRTDTHTPQNLAISLSVYLCEENKHTN